MTFIEKNCIEYLEKEFEKWDSNNVCEYKFCLFCNSELIENLFYERYIFDKKKPENAKFRCDKCFICFDEELKITELN